MSFDFSVLFTSAGLVSLFTLTILEIVLGVDNIIFISIITENLPNEKKKYARNLGLFIAMLIRIALLFAIGWIISLDKETISVFPDLFETIKHGSKTLKPGVFSIKELILLGGGLFLMYKSVTEIHDKITGSHSETSSKKKDVLSAIIFQIVIIDIIFSVDSILTAVGIVKEVPIMMGAVILSMGVMFVFAGKIADYINKRPTIKILALAFLVMIGFVLVCEAFNYELPKQLIYFAMAFSFIVEFFNIRMRKNLGKHE